MNPGELPISSSTREERRPPRETVGDRGRDGRQSYDPIVPVKVGNRRASEGAATVPTEGRGEQGDVSVEGNISETQNSRNYVHTIDRISELAKRGCERQFYSIGHMNHARSVVCGISEDYEKKASAGVDGGHVRGNERDAAKKNIPNSP